MKTYDEIDGSLVEIDPGSGGSFEIRDGKRIRVKEPGKPHKDGDRARHPDGEPVDKPQTTEDIEPALPAPGAAPWDDKKGA